MGTYNNIHKSVFFDLMKYCFYILIILFQIEIASAQNFITLKFLQNPESNTQIESFTKSNVRYISVSNLCDALKFQKIENRETKKLEIRTNLYTLKIVADNPFIIITDRNNNSNLIQLQLNAVYSGNSVFVPIASFIPILKTILSVDVSYDGVNINVGRISPKSMFDVTGLSFEQKSNGFLVRIHCTHKIGDIENWSKQIGSDSWLYLTLADARADVDAIKRTTHSGLVKQILVFQSPASVQLTIRFKGIIGSTEVLSAADGNDILLTVHPSTENQKVAERGNDNKKSREYEHDRWKLDVVVIDAGHGGDDPGAIGVSHTREKDVTLAIASQLGKLIENKLPGVKVIYTRKKDEFIELYRRGQIANQNGGKLFISIHCNSMPRRNHSENGFEIYLLRPGKTENALKIAERENAVIKYEQGYEKRYQQLTEENFILLTMAQSAYVKYSEQFAEILQNEMVKYLNVANNGVKQAGFYVLVGASMPNVLIETGYLSNKHDEKILKSAGGQRRLAESIFNGVKRYKQEYEKSLKEGRASGTE